MTDGVDPVAGSVAAYDAHADAYAAAHADAVAALVDRFCALLAPGSVVLDAGCGPGRDLARFGARGHAVVGADLSAAMLAIAATAAPGRLTRADLRRLPLRDGAVDAVWCCAALVHLAPGDAGAALAELARVTRAGGVVHVSVKAGDGAGWEDTAHGRRWWQRWTPQALAAAATGAGLAVDAVERGPVFVDLWARARRR